MGLKLFQRGWSSTDVVLKTGCVLVRVKQRLKTGAQCSVAPAYGVQKGRSLLRRPFQCQCEQPFLAGGIHLSTSKSIPRYRLEGQSLIDPSALPEARVIPSGASASPGMNAS